MCFVYAGTPYNFQSKINYGVEVLTPPKFPQIYMNRFYNTPMASMKTDLAGRTEKKENERLLKQVQLQPQRQIQCPIPRQNQKGFTTILITFSIVLKF